MIHVEVEDAEPRSEVSPVEHFGRKETSALPTLLTELCLNLCIGKKEMVALGIKMVRGRHTGIGLYGVIGKYYLQRYSGEKKSYGHPESFHRMCGLVWY
jgi:hypothetical protein